MSVEEMRWKVISVYPNATWEAKVLDMAENQVIAIYSVFRRMGKFSKRSTTKRKKQDKYHQITIFEYMKDIEARRNDDAGHMKELEKDDVASTMS